MATTQVTYTKTVMYCSLPCLCSYQVTKCGNESAYAACAYAYACFTSENQALKCHFNMYMYKECKKIPESPLHSWILWASQMGVLSSRTPMTRKDVTSYRCILNFTNPKTWYTVWTYYIQQKYPTGEVSGGLQTFLFQTQYRIIVW